MRQQKIVPLSELPLANDFMFGEVMRQENVCRLFLEALLEKKIARIEYIDKQTDLSDDAAAHGIRLDIYLADENNTHYNIEMQRSRKKALEMRIRYYQSGIDRRILEKGNDYRRLPESYVIFVCDFDYYQRGAARYERTSFVNGLSDLSYHDGSHAIILNSQYKNGNASDAILEFLDYLRTKDDTMQMLSELGRETKHAVKTVRSNPTKEVPYMTWAMKMRDVREEGWEEGREEGREEGLEKGIQAMVQGLRQLDVEPARIVQMLCSQFGLTAEKAAEKVKVYGKVSQPDA